MTCEKIFLFASPRLERSVRETNYARYIIIKTWPFGRTSAWWSGRDPEAGTACSAAAAGSTMPGTAGRPTGTGTSRTTATTTRVSALPQLQKGRWDISECLDPDPDTCGHLIPGGRSGMDSDVPVGPVDAGCENSSEFFPLPNPPETV